MPIHFLFSFSAAANVIPQPQNASKITSPLFELALIILSSSSKGF